MLEHSDDDKRALLVLSSQDGDEDEVVTADFVVGADGLESVIRQNLGGGSREESHILPIDPEK